MSTSDEDLTNASRMRCSAARAPDPQHKGEAGFAALFYAGCALFMAALLVFFRMPYGIPSLSQIAYYGLAAATPMAAMALALGSGGNRAVLAVGTIPTGLALFMLPGLHPLLVWPVSIAALLIIGASLKAYAKVPPVPVLFAGLALTVGFALYHFFAMNSQQYANIFSPEVWLAGKIQSDTAFHSAIATMIALFGVPSTGLDGLTWINYHVLSHVWLGVLAKSAGLNALPGYFLGMQVIAVPLLFFSLAVATMAFSQRAKGLVRPLFLILLNLCLSLIIHTVGWDSHLVSESYVLGLILLLAGVPLLKALSEHKQGALTVQHLLLGLTIGTLAFAAKVSVGFVWFAGFGYILLRTRQMRTWHYLVLGAWGIGLAVLALTLILPRDNVETTTFWPLHFLSYGDVATYNLAIIIIAFVVLIQRLRSTPSSRPWTEAVLIMLAASAVPALLFQIDAGAAFYFLNIGTWIAIAVLSAAIADMARNGRLGIVIKSATLVTAVALVALATATLPSQYTTLRTAYHSAFDAEEALAFRAQGPFSQAALGAIAGAYDRSVGAQMLAEVQRNDAFGRRDTLIFVPPEASWFWSSHDNCIVPPLAVPGVTGLPMLMGAPPTALGCELGQYYGYSSYGPQSRSVSMSDPALCDAGGVRGFSNVLVFDEAVQARMLSCESSIQAE